MSVARVLAISDEESGLLESCLSTGSLGRVDVVVSCGDLRPGYLDYVATSANAPLLYVRGNHDVDGCGYGLVGGTPLDLHVVRVGDVRVAGIDGSRAYREGIIGYSEVQMRWRVALLAVRALLAGGIDVLVTHVPPRGHGDLEDLPHQGFACFNWLLGMLRPSLMLCGHIHLSYGRIPRERMHPSGTRIVNACGFWCGDVSGKRATCQGSRSSALT